jgi:endonuclease III
MGSLDRVLWSVAFLKSTNGVADKISCTHFRELIKKSQPIRLDLYKRPLAIAAMLRQTSKWVKNTFVLMNIFQHIEQEWNGIPSQDFSEWLMLYEIGPKTGSLIFHPAFGKMMTLPVSSHVWHAFRKWEWTNAKSTDECS